jgi:hypothetical protein
VSAWQLNPLLAEYSPPRITRSRPTNSSLLGNPRVSGYLERHHSEILTEFRAIVAATSLEETGSEASEEPAFSG